MTASFATRSSRAEQDQVRAPYRHTHLPSAHRQCTERVRSTKVQSAQYFHIGLLYGSRNPCRGRVSGSAQPLISVSAGASRGIRGGVASEHHPARRKQTTDRHGRPSTPSDGGLRGPSAQQRGRAGCAPTGVPQICSCCSFAPHQANIRQDGHPCCGP